MAGTKISDATVTTPVVTDMIPFARVADAVARHALISAMMDLMLGDRTYTDDNFVTDDESLTDSVDALDQQLGDAVYTDDNFVTDAEDFTASIDALDQQLGDVAVGWLTSGETWTYASADDPTFTFTISAFDATTKYSAGMKLKLTQTTAKYFIITKVVFDDPGSTITIYGGTDYTLANATITSPYYSTQKSPHGFPLDPLKWTEEAVDSATTNQASPTQNQWYNINSFSLVVPIGSWNLGYQAMIGAVKTATTSIQVFGTLSKANNTVDDHELTVSGITYVGSATIRIYEHCNRSKFVTLAAKTTYYFNIRTILTGVDPISLQGADDYGHAIIRATCAYL